MSKMNGSYLENTKRFSFGVLAVLPLLAVYEYGVSQGALGHALNGADALLRIALAWVAAFFGIQYGTWLVGVVVGILAVGFLIYLQRERVSIKPGYMLGMFAEAAILGVVLALAVHLMLDRTLPRFFTLTPNPGVVQQLALQGLDSSWSKVVAAVGAGVFEELLFRVLLLGFFYRLWAAPDAALGEDTAAGARAVLVSSVLFTILHLGSVGMGGLISIFATSVLLSGLYFTRGYGIAALSHTAYDLYLMFGVVA